MLAFPELWGGNITILLAAMVVIGFRRPAPGRCALLTKVTPGVGLLWFGARREWRALLEAGLVTAAIVGVSVAPGARSVGRVAPAADRQHRLEHGARLGARPAAVRLPVAAVLILWAGWSGRRWLLPVGVLLAMPVIWWGSFAMLTATVALRRDRIEAHVDRFLRLLETRWGRRRATESVGTSAA